MVFYRCSSLSLQGKQRTTLFRNKTLTLEKAAVPGGANRSWAMYVTLPPIGRKGDVFKATDCAQAFSHDVHSVGIETGGPLDRRRHTYRVFNVGHTAGKGHQTTSDTILNILEVVQDAVERPYSLSTTAGTHDLSQVCEVGYNP